MNKFEVLGPVTLRNVKVRLTAAQLADRMHVVRSVEGADTLYEPIVEVSFKKGEVIEVDMDVPKSMYGRLRPLEDSSSEAVASAVEDGGSTDGGDVGDDASGAQGRSRGARRK